jgi:hypothetical protein
MPGMGFMAAARDGSLLDSLALGNRVEPGEPAARVLGSTRWRSALVVIGASVGTGLIIAFFRANIPFTLVAVTGVDLAALIVLLWQSTNGKYRSEG